jgi:hypothetical protein
MTATWRKVVIVKWQRADGQVEVGQTMDRMMLYRFLRKRVSE